MSASPLNPAVVLVATDRLADADLVRNVLAKEFAKVTASTRGEVAAAEFERARPDVVVLAFDSIAKSQQYCLGLMRFSKMAQSHPHRYVILCGGADLASVFPLCKQDYFDDYVLYWPQPHDGHRLVMAVWNAHRRLLAEQAQPSRAELASHAESAQALGAVVDRRLDEGLSHVQAVNASFAKVEQEVGKVRSQSTQVKSAMAASRETLAPMSEWAAGFRADVVPHVADAASLAKKVASQPTVFVVEDDAFAAKIICKSLEETFRVEVATEAKGLFGLLRRMRPAAILMDINLPGMDGLALTEWLKASPTFATIPVVMLTGEATRESIERSRTVGAADFIVKPFTRDALLAKLSRHLS